MSHVTEIQFEVSDLDVLARAAIDCGLELMRDKQTHRWFGNWVGDYAMPRGFNKEDLGKCDHAIGDPNSKEMYEVGVVARDGKYHLLWDFWAGGYGLQDKIGTNGDTLKQAYAVRATEKQAIKEGWEVNVQKQENGDVELVLRMDVGAGAVKCGASAQVGRNW